MRAVTILLYWLVVGPIVAWFVGSMGLAISWPYGYDAMNFSIFVGIFAGLAVPTWLTALELREPKGKNRPDLELEIVEIDGGYKAGEMIFERREDAEEFIYHIQIERSLQK